MDRLVRCDSLEAAAGWIHGLAPATPLPRTQVGPYEALEEALLPALAHPPCFVTFSGGRDSSTVLATAAALARREGLSLPVPVTRRYPDEPATDENEWQRSVVRHLGLSEWIRFEYRNGETDLLGEAAREGLRADGVLWPPALQTHRVMYRELGSGSLVTGEGGDAVLGDRRGTPLTASRNGAPRIATLRSAAAALLPRPIRQRRIARRARSSQQGRWLRPHALAEHTRLIAADLASEPLRFDASTWHLTRIRAFHALRHNHAAVAAEYQLRAFEPLLDEGFIAALARAGGRWGFGDRTDIMKAVFSEVLPTAVLERSTKAAFDRVYTSRATRDFAREWDGSGVDPDLVDIDRLRAVWLSERPTMATGVLLHSAWLASEGQA
ncbi:MAG: hypothetical protein KDB60_03710 [Propionibacteriaceae bacterium]|nr:hypothetical protein [Propionibacteriaceae bacterium]